MDDGTYCSAYESETKVNPRLHELKELETAWQAVLYHLNTPSHGASLGGPFLCNLINRGLPIIREEVKCVMRKRINEERVRLNIPLHSSCVWSMNDIASRVQFINDRLLEIREERKHLLYAESYQAFAACPKPFKFDSSNREVILNRRRIALKNAANDRGFVSWAAFEKYDYPTSVEVKLRCYEAHPLPKLVVPRERGTEGWKWRFVDGKLQYKYASGGVWHEHKYSDAIVEVVNSPTETYEDKGDA